LTCLEKSVPTEALGLKRGLDYVTEPGRGETLQEEEVAVAGVKSIAIVYHVLDVSRDEMTLDGLSAFDITKIVPHLLRVGRVGSLCYISNRSTFGCWFL